jgi:hypothetical protein
MKWSQMGLFEGVESAKMQENNPKLSTGQHRVKIEKCLAKKGFHGNAFICEYRVITSGHASDPVGSLRGWTQNMDKNEAIALGNMKAFAAACLGVNPKDQAKVEAEVSPVCKKALEESISSAQIFKGIELDVQVDPEKKTEKGLFTKHTFAPVTK